MKCRFLIALFALIAFFPIASSSQVLTDDELELIVEFELLADELQSASFAASRSSSSSCACNCHATTSSTGGPGGVTPGPTTSTGGPGGVTPGPTTSTGGPGSFCYRPHVVGHPTSTGGPSQLR